ncbi:MAG: MoaD/ThiS family protein [Planctomycetes bacterium]|nr:MoaD/ThiS family protein [Planctomycetota bacterium]
MIVHLPGALDDYTRGVRTHALDAGSLRQALRDLDARFPGLAFRLADEVGVVRRHIRVWVDGQPCEDLDRTLMGATEVHVTLALSGG